MPSILCKCGKRISYGEIPCKNEWLLISDVDFDKQVGLIDSEKLYSRFDHMLKCSNCGGIWVFWDGFSKPPTHYLRLEPTQT